MDRFVVMVDAGYLLHKSVEIVSGRASTERGDLELTDPAALVKLLVEQTRRTLDLGGKELLRVYWFDGVMSGGLTPQQRGICELPDVNFRAGLVNSKGQQKGVDSLIVTDLFELASNRAICDAALVTGDSDLAIGIELAQKKGVRVAVLGIEDLAIGVSSGLSREITDRADRVARIGSADLTSLMKYVPRVKITMSSPQVAPISVPSTTAAIPKSTTTLGHAQECDIDGAVTAYIAANPPPSGTVDPSTKRIAATVDRTLINHVYTTLGHGRLTNLEKVYMRRCFLKQLGF